MVAERVEIVDANAKSEAMPPLVRAHPARPCATCACALCLACVLCGLAPLPCRAAQPARPNVGEAYIFNQPAEDKPAYTPGQALQQSLARIALSPARLLDPSSSLWAGAQGLRLSHERTAVLLATNVIAESGDTQTAAASHADGRIELFGAANCTSVNMPEGHPAYALALAREGTVLAAWAQGLNRLVFFDLTRPGCPASSVEVALRGQLKLTMSASGAFLAAQDETGRLWVGPRGGEMRSVTGMSGEPAALGFSDGEGVLLAIDSEGLGGAWNPRTGKILHPLKVPGGPFVRGDYQGAVARLWTREGRKVRWNVLLNRPAQADSAPQEAPTGHNEGWLELRGAELHYVRPGLSWRPNTMYEVKTPLLAHSRHAHCLRLTDMDGLVRYYDARTGLPRTQCFAEDWTPVPIQPDGTAKIPGLGLRIFEQVASSSGNSLVNVRAISENLVLLWTEAAPNLTLSVVAPAIGGMSAKVEPDASLDPRPPTVLSVSLRQGIGDQAPATRLLLQ